MKKLIKLVLNGLFSFFGYSFISNKELDRIYNKKIAEGQKDDSFEKSVALVLTYSMLSKKRLYNIWEMIEYVVENNIEGDIVECGVWKGGSVGMMARSLLNQNVESRKLHLFDAFDDICEPDYRVDGDRAIKEVGGTDFAQGKLEPVKGIYNYLGKDGHGTMEECKELLIDKIKYPMENIEFHQGWFQDTLVGIEDEINKISLLRIDADWYASTKVCLDSLYQLVSKGGVIIIDDYLAYDGCEKAVDEFFLNQEFKPFFNFVDKECIYFFKYD